MTSPDGNPDVVLTDPDNTNDDLFGVTVSSAGDINGDGYSDVIVGANLADGGGSNRGRAYISYGGLGYLDDPEQVNGDQFGYSVSGAGDVNGDGYSDVIVGANGADGGGTNRGRAYIFFGKKAGTGGLVANVVLTDPDNTDSDEFGYSVSGAGDVNGDGYSDTIVGAYGADGGGTNRGRAYIFYGASSMTTPDGSPDVVLTDPDNTNSDQFGYSVSEAGDVNGDGYSDVIVGAYFAEGGGSARGRAYIFYGASSMTSPDGTPDVVLTDPDNTDNDYFGYSVSGAGDVNGDGYSDVIVGAPLADGGGGTDDDRGEAYTFFGGTSTATSLPEFLFAAKNSNSTDTIQIDWNGSSSQKSYSYKATSAINTLKLKIEAYDQSGVCDGTTGWWQLGDLVIVKEVNYESTISRTISSCPSDYYDGSNWAYVRVSQTSTTGILRTDNMTFTFGTSGPVTAEQMYHGKWFNSSGVEQGFTF